MVCSLYTMQVSEYSTSKMKNTAHIFVYIAMAQYRIILPIYFRVTSLALKQSYDFPRAGDATWKKMEKMDRMNQPQTYSIATTKHSQQNRVHNYGM